MKQKPILFSTAMVQAILAGSKTQTRRIIKPQPDDSGLHNHTDYPIALDSELEGWCGTVEETGEFKEYGLPYYPGDVLYVRETFRKCSHYAFDYEFYQYKDLSTLTHSEIIDKDQIISGKWKPSIHMPKEAARIWLQITNVRVERLRDITESDSVAEGVETLGFYPGYNVSSRGKFEGLWNKINGPESWELNPWVWVVEFKRIEKP